ncbi:teneurin-a-like [Pollicipes pollicipes]|uniref:teneurin-a-like n=1 Tax=Pollicipes pollicipes TaxID=41117 RepID=UPI00188527D3|nr:teneurin-a-like [Pollicipes pollicipes]
MEHWFDFMVNGGGAVNLQFQRAPFRPMTRAVAAAWNQLVVLEPITMLLDTEPAPHLLRPVIVNTWQPDLATDAAETVAVVTETQVLQESIEIPGTGLRLVYNSQDASGYHSTLLLRLTSDPVPETLILVHLKVIVEGTVFTKTFESDPNITYSYSWNKRNVYEQKPHLLRPVIVNTWQPDLATDAAETVAWVTETQVLQESIEIPGTGLRLVYNSQDASGYHSTLLLRLTSDPVPETLILVHLKVIVEGTVFTKTFESDPNITYSYSWNKRNVYEQKVYGMVQAHVSVGYQYVDCAGVIWDSRMLPIPGFRMDISDIGGWNLDIHHMYNFHEGILQRGDGTSVHFKRHPRLVETCSGAANSSRLLTPVALATGADGSVYVGDFNLIRRVTPAGGVFTVAELKATQVSYNYYMAMSPVEQLLYISDPEAHQVFRVIQMDQVSDPSKNLERVAGTGERCLPGDDAACGDGKLALDAKLSHPKGLAISADMVVYLADGTNIRVIGADGIISTLIGHHGHKAVWRPIPCSGALPLPEWPTAVALSPVDGSLHFLDDRLVLRLTPDRKVEVRAGRPPAASPLAPLGTLVDLTFDADGALYLAEVDAGKVHYKDQCACEPAVGPGAAGELATRTHLVSVSALAAGPDGSLHVADQGTLKILRLRHNLPHEGPEFKVIDPVQNKVYGFNRFGQHVETKDLLTGRSIYLFQYSKNTSFGRLSKITDWSGNSVQLVRDYSSVVSSIENSQGERCTLHHMTRDGLVTNFTTSGNKYHFQYDPETELLRCRSDSRGDVFLYDYDSTGRLQQALTSTGERLRLSSRLVPPRFLQVTVARDDQAPFVLDIDSTQESTSFTYEDTSTVVQTLANNTIVLSEPHDTDTYVTFTKIQQMSLLYSPPVQVLDAAVSQRRVVRADLNHEQLENELALTMAPLQGNQMHGFLVARTLQSNGSEVVSLDYDPVTLRQTVYTAAAPGAAGARQVTLSVKYRESVEPDTWSPAGLPPMVVSYDSIGRLGRWRWGELTQEFSYSSSRSGLARRQAGASSDTFTYDPNNQPATFTLPSRRQYEYHYDSRGGLQFIITPSRSRHFLHVQPSLGYVKFQYVPPGGQQHPWVRRGDGETRFTYAPSGALVSVRHSERFFGYRFELAHQGPLLRERREQFDPETGLSSAVFRYEYDGRLRPTGVTGRVGGRRLAPLELRYSARTGQLTQLGPFSVQRVADNETVLAAGGARLTRATDRYGREASMALTVGGREVYRARRQYDNAGRLAAERVWRPELGGQPRKRTLHYGPDGELTGDDADDSWRFEYDRNGNMVQLRFKQSNISLQVNEHDRLVQLSGGQLRYDSSGAVVENFREHKYRYDARGLLAAAVQPTGGQVHYYYDHERRLLARKDQLGNITQFFYGDPRHPLHVTHVYRPRSDQLTEILYDDEARPVMVRADARRYTVVSDTCGTPLLLYDERGRLAREVRSAAFGHQVSNSWPELYLPVGFCGGLWDAVTELLHMPGGRVYDPLVGQWLAPDVDGLLSNLMNPRKLHLYRFNGNDPINVRPRDVTPTDEAGWLERLGYRSQPGPLGPGVILVVNLDGRVQVRGLPSVDPIASDVLTTVFNQSFLVNVTTAPHRLDVFHFVKTALWSFADDHDQLTRLAQFNVTAHKHSGDEPGRHTADLRIHTGTASVHLLRRGFASRRWSDAEREAILAREGVAGLDFWYRHEPHEYPELAGDPFNVRFGRAG